MTFNEFAGQASIDAAKAIERLDAVKALILEHSKRRAGNGAVSSLISTQSAMNRNFAKKALKLSLAFHHKVEELTI